MDAVDTPPPAEEAPRPDPDRPGGPVPAPATGGLGVLLGGLAALWGLHIGLSPLYDNSFLTHLATGRLILDDGIPRVDPYSFTAAGEPWTVQSWLASWLYAQAERIGDLGGVRLLQGVLCALLGAAVWRLTQRSGSLYVRIAVTAAVLAAGVELWAGRPLLFGLLGVAAVLLAADGLLDPRWLVPVGWVWVNTHGSFPFAVVLVALLAVGRRLDDGRWGPEVPLLGWTTLGVALGAVGPLGPRLLLFPARLLERREAFEAVVEWQAPTYRSYGQVLVLGLVLLAVLGLVRRPSWRAALPVVAFAGLALTSQRNAAVLLLVLVPVLAASVPRLGSARFPLARPAVLAGTGVLVVLGLVLVSSSLRGPDADLDGYPVDAMAWMDDRGLWAEGARVVSYDYVGNYRTAVHGAEARVFFDDRVDMYPLEVIEDYRTLLAGGPEWDEVLDRRAATAVLWRADSPLGDALDRSPGWDVVHQDDPWIVAVPAATDGED